MGGELEHSEGKVGSRKHRAESMGSTLGGKQGANGGVCAERTMVSGGSREYDGRCRGIQEQDRKQEQ